MKTWHENVTCNLKKISGNYSLRFGWERVPITSPTSLSLAQPCIAQVGHESLLFEDRLHALETQLGFACLLLKTDGSYVGIQYQSRIPIIDGARLLDTSILLSKRSSKIRTLIITPSSLIKSERIIPKQRQQTSLQTPIWCSNLHSSPYSPLAPTPSSPHPWITCVLINL